MATTGPVLKGWSPGPSSTGSPKIITFRIPDYPKRQRAPSASQQSSLSTVLEVAPCCCSSNSEASSTSAQSEYIPRPQNSWLLFKNDFCLRHCSAGPDIFRRAREVWRTSDPALKRQWGLRAKEVAKIHAREHPGWKYDPRKRRKKNDKNPKRSGRRNQPSRPSEASSAPTVSSSAQHLSLSPFFESSEIPTPTTSHAQSVPLTPPSSLDDSVPAPPRSEKRRSLSAPPSCSVVGLELGTGPPDPDSFAMGVLSARNPSQVVYGTTHPLTRSFTSSFSTGSSNGARPVLKLSPLDAVASSLAGWGDNTNPYISSTNNGTACMSPPVPETLTVTAASPLSQTPYPSSEAPVSSLASTSQRSQSNESILGYQSPAIDSCEVRWSSEQQEDVETPRIAAAPLAPWADGPPSEGCTFSPRVAPERTGRSCPQPVQSSATDTRPEFLEPSVPYMPPIMAQLIDEVPLTQHTSMVEATSHSYFPPVGMSSGGPYLQPPIILKNHSFPSQPVRTARHGNMGGSIPYVASAGIISGSQAVFSGQSSLSDASSQPEILEQTIDGYLYTPGAPYPSEPLLTPPYPQPALPYSCPPLPYSRPTHLYSNHASPHPHPVLPYSQPSLSYSQPVISTTYQMPEPCAYTSQASYVNPPVQSPALFADNAPIDVLDADAALQTYHVGLRNIMGDGDFWGPY
ncbi:hypothetical protein FISHEDRAFT_73801 [Fistulina hepatica ATCC 64428]|uniref:HMG box domain-containing protein n=1 Tax=Fistulina hepatica ATCC 64428 TaxID=1128425 RepID=A0A0D7ACU7_9AGAR|nr:hypothetical protein FISHEDRAFT_73801 [Fistulina hepatica ATCC 64428]